jgi:putative colanic acid biosynthesis acetyltransferase WcaF
MSDLRYKIPNQKDAYTSSWSVKETLLIRMWHIVWILFFRYSPKQFNFWRILLLKLFGAKLDNNVFIYASAKIYVPWLLTMKDKSCLGPFSEVYNLGPVYIYSEATISQYAYICNGSHDFSKSNLPLIIGDIYIGSKAFIGAKAFIMPGITIGECAIVGACAVVTKDVKPFDVVGGNPAKVINKRVIND